MIAWDASPRRPLWHPEADARGLGIIAVQWWLGPNAEDYYHPGQFYPILERVMRDQQLGPGTALLHGFSRGSANVFALEAIDRARPHPFFSVILANSGGYQADFHPNRGIDAGDFGPQPLLGTKWIFYAGGRDPNPDRDGLPAMKRSRHWVESQGGKTILDIADSNGDHGGFHRSTALVRRALDAFPPP